MIIAQIATIPEREKTLQIAVESLYGQVDIVHVIPDSPTDGWKFKGIESYDLEDIILICDDDIKYPPDFAEKMIGYLDFLGGGVVTCMGKNLKPRPIGSFYRDELECFKTFSDVKEFHQVEISGTCALAFRRKTFPDLTYKYFESINSDIWLGVYCKDRDIPCFVVPHSFDWLTNLMPLLPIDTPSVFDRFKNNDKHMTDLVNKKL